MTQFQVGSAYFCRSVCNYDSVWTFKIASRTAKTIKTECGKTLRIHDKLTAMNQSETVFPLGRYSMAPILSAEKVVK